MITRGIKRKMIISSVPNVCTCHCHELGKRIRHFVACCHPPKNIEEENLVSAYYSLPKSHEELEKKMNVLTASCEKTSKKVSNKKSKARSKKKKKVYPKR